MYNVKCLLNGAGSVFFEKFILGTDQEILLSYGIPKFDHYIPNGLPFKPSSDAIPPRFILILCMSQCILGEMFKL